MHKRWGFGLCYDYLRNVKRFNCNHKRVYRTKPKRCLKRDKADALSVPVAMNQLWSMVFISDTLK